MEYDLDSGSHSVYSLHYHLILTASIQVTRQTGG
jgi:hypothetical protein